MTTWLRRGASAHARRFLSASAEPIRYLRGPRETTLTRASPGSRRSEQQTAGGGVDPSWREMDWFCMASELTLDGQVIRPQTRDVVEWTTPAGELLIYTVQPISRERAWDTADQLGVLIRFHTKLQTELFKTV